MSRAPPAASGMSSGAAPAPPSPVGNWWQLPAERLAATIGDATGLSEAEATRRLAAIGPNTLHRRRHGVLWQQTARRLANPLILMLLFAAAVSASTGETVSAAIIVVILVVSVVSDVLQEARADRAMESLRQSVALRAQARRDGSLRDINATALVPGDVVSLRAGQLVPADGRLLEAQHLFVQQAALTGEAAPVEKEIGAPADSAEPLQARGALFMGSTVVSGTALMLVCATGMATELGQVAGALLDPRQPTAFERGIHDFGLLVLRVTLVLAVVVLAGNLLLHKPLLESVMFTLALAVGIAPELLPMIVTVTLARGALRLADEQVIVKRLGSIHDLGAMDLLCTDKTGTLTEGQLTLAHCLDAQGKESATTLEFGWLNCHFESGIRTPIEDAVLNAPSVDPARWRKLDEIPFDFERRRVSVLLEHDDGQRWLILKGAPEAVLQHCSTLLTTAGGYASTTGVPLDDSARQQLQQQIAALDQAGYRSLAVAVRPMPPDCVHAGLGDEAALQYSGLLVFADPPKTSAASALRRLQSLGIEVCILTGDSEGVARQVCTTLGMPVRGVLNGSDIAALDSTQLSARLQKVSLCCRVSPAQKEAIVRALKARGRTVGFLGDGINDAPPLRAADVGISVDTAVDVAREAADLILLRHDLDVLADGVQQGRRTFINVRKYIMMGTSSNFGNMLSMAAGSLYLPFLPLLPPQILLNNLLYDISESTIPLDRVDAAEAATPQRWDLGLLLRFMIVFGLISTLFDLLTFALLLEVFHLAERAFQTGWFVESLVTQALVIFVIRTRLPALQSPPAPALAWTACGVAALALVLPYLPFASHLGFVPLPWWFYPALAGLIVTYLLLTEAVKARFHSHFGAPAGPR